MPTSPKTFSFGTLQLSRISSVVEDARMPSLSSFLPTENPSKLLFDDKRRDAFVARVRIDGRKQQKDLRFVAVRDPEFLAGQLVMIAFIDRTRFQRESVRARTCLDKRICADLALASCVRYFFFCSSFAQRINALVTSVL